MKRFLCLLCVLCLLPVLAVASGVADLEEFIYVYNYLAETYQTQTLPEKYNTWKMDNGDDMLIFSFSDSLKFHAYVKNKKVYGFSVICGSDDAALDFLMACEVGNSCLDSDIHIDVLLDYMMSRTDGKPYVSKTKGYAYYLKKEGNEYTYIIAKE